MPKYLDIEIKKPLFGTFCYIRKEAVDHALKYKKLLRITIPQGVGIISPKDWLKEAKYMEKVFMRPDEPMKLYGNYVPVPNIEKPQPKPKKRNPNAPIEGQMGLF